MRRIVKGVEKSGHNSNVRRWRDRTTDSQLRGPNNNKINTISNILFEMSEERKKRWTERAHWGSEELSFTKSTASDDLREVAIAKLYLER